MSLGLNPNCLERLSEVVALALGQIAVEHHMFVNFDSVSDLLRAESVLPLALADAQLALAIWGIRGPAESQTKLPSFAPVLDHVL